MARRRRDRFGSCNAGAGKACLSPVAMMPASSLTLPPDPNRQRLDLSHLGILEWRGIAQVVQYHREAVVAPESLLADDESRHAERTLRNRPIGVGAQPLLDFGILERQLRISHPELPGQ